MNCTDCHQTLCINPDCTTNELTLDSILRYPIYYHQKCLECDEKLVCCPTGVCIDCIVRFPTHIIYKFSDDAYISLGNKTTSYDPFDIIVNLDYPHNNVKLGEIKVTLEKGKKIINCGIEDDPSFYMERFMREMFSRIVETLYTQLEDKISTKVLFHCYAGISRSATVLILFLSDFLNLSTLDVYKIVKKERKCILPNKLFKMILDL